VISPKGKPGKCECHNNGIQDDTIKAVRDISLVDEFDHQESDKDMTKIDIQGSLPELRQPLHGG
jgi:hypothetical protein